jgi:pimeloyl-ACP methyl ester carboxylesterase
VQLDERVSPDSLDPDDDPRDRLPAFAVTQHTPAGDVRVHVWPGTEGPVHRPVLFCLHGWTDSGEVFGPLAAALGRRWTVVAPDAPGHGGTPWTPAARYRVADLAGPALAVLDRLPELAGRRARVVLLGHSMGALTASRLAAARPGVVTHLVLEDPARTAVRRGRTAAAMREWITGLRALDHAGIMAWAHADTPGWPVDELDAWATGKEQVSLESLSVPVDWGEPLVALLADVPAPVTLVHGRIAAGGLVSSIAARRCAAACRAGCDVVPLDTGHNPRREAREQFIAVLAAALGRHER